MLGSGHRDYATNNLGELHLAQSTKVSHQVQNPLGFSAQSRFYLLKFQF
jgi:hypothetical protein